MAEQPDKILIFCQKCGQQTSLSSIHRTRGTCSACQNNTWHVQATYLARQDTADGTTLALNAMGLSILNSSGVMIGGPLPAEKKPVNGIDIHDVPAETMCDIADPAVDPSIKLNAFVQLKQNERFQQHRKKMEQHGQECIQCGILYVLNDKKPWTLVGTCSKVCCASQHGVSDYAMIEDEVVAKAQSLAPEVRQRQRDNQLIHVQCPACLHEFDLAKIYSGVVRKCPSCQAKVQVPAS
ncbi:MAG: hypothetical protein U0930_02665 [Pirellulales bacterium]